MTLALGARWRWLLKLLLLVTPLRSYRVRQWALRTVNHLRRRRRRRAEAGGDDRLSRPALFEMDIRLSALLGRGGYFVEAGANDGFTQSNTYLLERFHGWRGLLVEPAPALAREARLERPASHVVQCALVPPDLAGAPVTLHYAGLQSLVAGARGSEEADREWIADGFLLGERDHHTFTAPGRTLSEVLDEVQAPEVDLLSLDLEGYEPQALEGLDLERHGPRWMLIEAHEEEARAQIERRLGSRYAYAGRFSPWDALYRRADVPEPAELAELLRAP